MLMPIVLIAPTVEAANSDPIPLGLFAANGQPTLPITIMGTGFSGADSAKLQFSWDGKAAFEDVVLEGITQTLSSNQNMLTLYAPGYYRISKGVTTGAVGVAACLVRGV